jgi:hypothetical protein
MRRAIVHIGTPRTGTTTLQRYLFENRERLLTCGVLYPVLTPRTAPSPHLSHQYLGESFDGRRSAAERVELMEALERLISDTSADIVMLSYEGLSQAIGRSRTPGLLAALFARHGFVMETLLTVRPQSEYLNSLYTHRIQFLREGRPFLRFLDSAVNARTMHYEALLRPWHAACAGRLRVVPLRDARTDEPFVGRVLTELGMGDRIDGLSPSEPVASVENPSPGPIAIEACRQLRLGGAEPQLGAAAREATRFLEQRVVTFGLDALPFRAIDADLAAQLVRRFLSGNDGLAHRLWGEPWASRVANEPYQAVNEIAGRPVDIEVRRHIDQIIAETCARFEITCRGYFISAVRQYVADLQRFVRRAAKYLRHAV